jgi:hypothetical protein
MNSKYVRQKEVKEYRRKRRRSVQADDLSMTSTSSSFYRIGKVRDLRLMMEPSGANRGYAYIRYYTPEVRPLKIMSSLKCFSGMFF